MKKKASMCLLFIGKSAAFRMCRDPFFILKLYLRDSSRGREKGRELCGDRFLKRSCSNKIKILFRSKIDSYMAFKPGEGARA